MKKPDNVVFNYEENQYDAFKREYPTSFNSKNFNLEKIENIKLESKPYFKEKFLEIKKKYDELIEKFKWNEIIFNSKHKFNPIIGREYYLYQNKNATFLSIIKPSEWKMKYIGTFKLDTKHTWQKIN